MHKITMHERGRLDMETEKRAEWQSFIIFEELRFFPESTVPIMFLWNLIYAKAFNQIISRKLSLNILAFRNMTNLMTFSTKAMNFEKWGQNQHIEVLYKLQSHKLPLWTTFRALTSSFFFMHSIRMTNSWWAWFLL